MSLASDFAANRNAIQVAVTTKDTVDSISPEDVGGAIESVNILVETYLIRSNKFYTFAGSDDPNVTPPTFPAPQEDDVYQQGITNGIVNWKKQPDGTWLNESTTPIGFEFGDGPITIRDFIDGLLVTVTPGNWAINNTIYRQLTQTQLAVTAPDLNFLRYDGIFADTFGVIYYEEGVASATPAYPTLPPNTIAVDYVVVPPSSSGNPAYLLYNDSSGSSTGGQTIYYFTNADVVDADEGNYIEYQFDGVAISKRPYSISNRIGTDEEGITPLVSNKPAWDFPRIYGFQDSTTVQTITVYAI